MEKTRAQTILFPCPLLPASSKPVLINSLPRKYPSKQAAWNWGGPENVRTEIWLVREPTLPWGVPIYFPHLVLEGGHLERTQPGGDSPGFRQRVGTMFWSPGAQTPTTLRTPSLVSSSPPPPFPVNPWLDAKERRQPSSEARPSRPSIRALFAPTWSPEKP